MKNILILYASYGGGHLSAANSIEKCLNENHPNIHTEVIDCIKYINKTLDKVTTGAYREMAKKAPNLWGRVYSGSQNGLLGHISSRSNKVMAIKLKNLIKEKNPDLIISTHPFGSQMVNYLKRKGKVNCKLATIMTDFAPHEQWLIGHQYTDYFFVAHEKMKTNLIEYGIEENKIYATGIPLSDRFLQKYDSQMIYDSFQLNKDKKTILFFGGGEFGLGKEKTIQIFRSLVQNIQNYQLIAIAGKNEKMKESFEQIVKEFHLENTTKVLGYTNQVPELMSISHLVITKPGGLTTTEILASHLPMIIINPIPGQEEENAELLESYGVGIWIKKEDNPSEIFQKVLNSDELIHEMKEKTNLLSKPNSTKTICEILTTI